MASLSVLPYLRKAVNRQLVTLEKTARKVCLLRTEFVPRKLLQQVDYISQGRPVSMQTLLEDCLQRARAGQPFVWERPLSRGCWPPDIQFHVRKLPQLEKVK